MGTKALIGLMLLGLVGCGSLPCSTPVPQFTAQTIDAMTPAERREYLKALETSAAVCKQKA